MRGRQFKRKTERLLRSNQQIRMNSMRGLQREVNWSRCITQHNTALSNSDADYLTVSLLHKGREAITPARTTDAVP